MEDTLNDHPSLPANYVSLANLQQRWLKQQQQQKERQECQQQQLPKPHKGNKKPRNKLQMKAKIIEPQKPSIGIADEGVAKFVKPNPNFKFERSIRRNFDGRNRSKRQALKNEGNFPIGVKIDNGDHLTTMESNDKELQLEPSKVESNVAEKVEIVGGDQFGTEKKIMDEKVKKCKKKKKKKKSKQDGAVNGENVKERENRGKEGNGDQTVGIRRRFEKIFVDRRERRSDGRCTASIDGRRGVYRSYERVGHRGLERKRLEKGMVWVKKGEASEQSEVS